MYNVCMKNRAGFTLVELLIVIVVIAILASISVVAYNGIQARARDAQRKHDIQTIARALELYYIDHGQYPIITGSYYWTPSYPMDARRATTLVPDSWEELRSHLAPYISNIGMDPLNQRGPSSIGHDGRYGYEYESNPDGERCNIPRRTGQAYHLYYKLETEPQINEMIGTCVYLAPNSTVVSSYSVVKPL